MNDYYSVLLYEYKNTTIQPEVKFGVYPPSKTEKKLVSRYVHGHRDWLKDIMEGDITTLLEFDKQLKPWKLKEFLKEQYWVLVDFFHGQPGGGEREISYTREAGLELQSFKEISSKLGISSSQESGTSSSQEVGISGFNLNYSDSMKIKYDVSQELSKLAGENVTISARTSKQHITKIPPQPFEWYFAIYQLIDVYTINVVEYTPKKRGNFKKAGEYEEYRERSKKREAGYFAEKNFKSGLKKPSYMSDFNFKSETFEVPTLYFCEKFDPPLK